MQNAEIAEMELLHWLSRPVFFPCFVGMTLALLFWRRLPTVSLLAFMVSLTLAGLALLNL
jgi:hypothetical protein